MSLFKCENPIKIQEDRFCLKYLADSKVNCGMKKYIMIQNVFDNNISGFIRKIKLLQLNSVQLIILNSFYIIMKI